MRRIIKTGIDIGTYQTKVMVCELQSGSSSFHPKIIGIGQSETKGVRHGYITNQNEVRESLAKAIQQAERQAGLSIRRAYVSGGGVALSSTSGSGTSIVTRADNQITELDIEKAISEAEKDLPPSQTANRKTIHAIPIQYKIDGKTVIGKPTGFHGNKIEARAVFISVMEQHLTELLGAVEGAGIEVEDVIAAPLASSIVTLTKAQKIAGCILTNIGSETVTIAVFENGLPLSVEVFPIGSNDITNDIALGLRIPLEEAEEVKRGNIATGQFPRKKLEEIIIARLSDIFELIDAHLKKINKQELLPAGIILTGGGSGIATIDEFAKASLRLPSRLATISTDASSKIHVKDATWSVAYGLCVLGFNSTIDESFGHKAIKTKNTIVEWIKQFLP